MVGKVQLVSGMADWTAHSITQDADSWKQYLTTASRLYKYNFDDQLLIYAQKPDAEACASMELWNNTMHRWVKRGAKGIALLRQRDGGRPYLTYVFDVADTRPVRGAREPRLWKMGEEYLPAVLEMLKGQYGTDNSGSLGKCLMEAVEHAVEKALPEYLQDLAYDRGSRHGAVQDSPVRGKDGRSPEAYFREVLCASVQYTVLTRCGLDGEEYLEPDRLGGIRAFSDPAALHHLGNAVSTVSMGILQEIGRTIRHQDRELAERLQKIRKEKEDGKNEEKPLENPPPIRYTDDIQKFNALKRESIEGREQHGESGIQEVRGIPDSGAGSGRGGRDGRNAPGEIRDAEAELPAGVPQGDIHLHAADGQAPAAFEGNRQAGAGAGGSGRGGDDEAERSGRSSEGEEPDGLGAGSERLHGDSRGRGTSGDRVPLRKEEAVAPQEPEGLSRERLLGAEGGRLPERNKEAAEKVQSKEQETAGQNPAVSVSLEQDSVISASLPISEQNDVAREPGTGESLETESAQISLFPTVEGQLEHIARAQEMRQTEKDGSSTTRPIPWDVVDRALTCGGNDKDSLRDSKMRLVSYYMQGHSPEECTAFLKKERSGRLLWYGGCRIGYGSMGVEIIRQDEASGTNGYDAVKLDWKTVETRIRGMVQGGTYLNREETAFIPEYEKQELARQIYDFQYRDSARRGKGKREWDSQAAQRDYRPMLEDAKYTGILYQDMKEAFGAVSPEDAENYPLMRKTLEMMEAYVQGKYSLFTPLSVEALRGQHRGREGAKQKKQENAEEQSRAVGKAEPGQGAGQERNPEKKTGNRIGRQEKTVAGGELETAARILAGKQQKTKEGTGGQLAFDFSVFELAEEPDVPEWLQEQEQPEGEDGEPGRSSRDLGEAKLLIDAFCRDEYDAEPVDFDNLEHIGLAWNFIEDEQYEITILAEANLLDFSISKFVDDICVEKRQYGSLRELIDRELYELDYAELVHLGNVDSERLVELGIPKEQLGEVTGSVLQEREQCRTEAETETGKSSLPHVEGEIIKPGRMDLPESGGQAGTGEKEIFPETVEIDGGQVVAAEPVEETHIGLPYELVMPKDPVGQELPAGPESRPGSELHNFRITDEALGTGGQKAKFQNNLAAIRTLKEIEGENRMAAPEEQEVLSKYVGWGGLAQAFDPSNEKWAKEYAQLREALTPEEYESARSTVLNAHYTSPIVIGAVYEALGRMDFIPGNILEPSCGIGNFFGLLPEEYGHSRLYGVELDSLTGRIAGQLYQKAYITVGGFEQMEFPDDFFDLAVGNVPFGEYKVHDRRYDRQNLLIHDYFLTKALDKVRPGGVMAFLTSKGTMDKANSSVREGLAQKADLLGAIRLPNTAFQRNAGTTVTADILFFQKRGSAPERLPDWVHTGQTAEGIPINRYFLRHPEMVLGRMAFTANRYGNETDTACLPFEGVELKDLLVQAVSGIAVPDRELLQMDAPGQKEQGNTESIPADPEVRNFSFTEKGGKFYFRENSRMKTVELKGLPAQRARGMIAIRDSARRLIDLQLSGAGDEEVTKEQAGLNALYDSFQKKYGLLNSPGNRNVFRQDSSYPLLSSLEVLDGEGNFKCKADMFYRRTINYRSPVSSVDTAVEALGVSIGERACVDLEFMASLMGGSEKIPQIVADLKGIIFKAPSTGPFDPGMQGEGWDAGWQAADEYLSGNVRQKLEEAKEAASTYPEFAVNVEALEKVQPKELSAPEISVRIGVPWIDTKYYRQFLFELLNPPTRLRRGKVDVLYSESTGEWHVKRDVEAVRQSDTRVWNTYGTKRISAYEIFENTLNQRPIQIFDYKESEDGREIRVLNGKETAIAQQKQEAIKEAFQNWIFKEPERRADLCGIYNRLFNSVRPREYDGRHIIFSGMNPEKRLEAHQRNAVARILYGGNTLLAHVVGAGKTYEMVAAAMEGRRLGLCRKTMIVVPNHLTEQWGGEFLSLYPGAKVLVATKKDFERKNRKRFCARIATGDYDAVIIGHGQFEKIPLSTERQEAAIKEQIDGVVDAILEAKIEKQEYFTVKQMERTKKRLEERLQKLHDKKKDDTVTFEELGIDRLFVDEAHYYKNLYLQTKMSNVAGVTQSSAQKSSDMFDKCRYLDEITGGKGIVFATGTPISNSVVELYTMMRYLQYDMLETGFTDSTGQTRSLLHFDNWAATFGEQVTAVELKPEGTGFRLKTRFSRFYNLPELMNLWKEAADIQTAEMLKLPVPEAEYITIQTEPSPAQKEMVKGLAERAEKIRSEKLDPVIDNMLKVTSDGRKLALDQRILNPLLPDDPGSKVNACVENVFRIWQETADTRGAQLIFSDLSTPKGKAAAKKESPEQEAEAQNAGLEGKQSYGEKATPQGTEGRAEEKREEAAPQDGTAIIPVNRTAGENGSVEGEPTAEEEAAGLLAEEIRMESSVYEDIRKKLIARGVPAEEVAFIHSANTETQKAELFAKVREGQVRILLGSTQKMGAGTNVQTRLVASHDLDCPWRPADLEQRAGRIIRRGNQNQHVRIYRYVTKGTFDAYTWGLVESKQKFIGQVMTGKSPMRSMEDVDATALSYAEVKMLATGDSRIKEKMDLDIQVTKLKMLKSNHLSQQYELQDRVRGYYPNKLKETQLYIDCLEADLPVLEAHPVKEDVFSMTVMGTDYAERKEAGRAIVAACRLIDEPGKEIELGEYRGFPMKLSFSDAKFKVTMKQHLTYTAELSDDQVGNIARINNALERIPQSLEAQRENLARFREEMENAKEEMEKPFTQEQELTQKSARLAELNTALDNEEKGREEPKAEKKTGKGQEKQVEEKSWENGEVCPGRAPEGRPSILKALKEYEPPAPAKPGMGRKREREVDG